MILDNGLLFWATL